MRKSQRNQWDEIFKVLTTRIYSKNLQVLKLEEIEPSQMKSNWESKKQKSSRCFDFADGFLFTEEYF